MTRANSRDVNIRTILAYGAAIKRQNYFSIIILFRGLSYDRSDKGFFLSDSVKSSEVRICFVLMIFFIQIHSSFSRDAVNYFDDCIILLRFLNVHYGTVYNQLFAFRTKKKKTE